MTDEVINIREPYYTAGTKYGWPGDPKGVGLHPRYLYGEGLVRMRIARGATLYICDKLKLRLYIKEHMNVEYVKGRTKLYIVPLWLFNKGKKRLPGQKTLTEYQRTP